MAYTGGLDKRPAAAGDGQWRNAAAPHDPRPGAGSLPESDELLAVRLTPRARVGRLRGFGAPEPARDRRAAVPVLLAQVAAAPVAGRANAELIAPIAHAARVPRSALRIVTGHRARTKLLRVPPGTLAALRRHLATE